MRPFNPQALNQNGARSIPEGYRPNKTPGETSARVSAKRILSGPSCKGAVTRAKAKEKEDSPRIKEIGSRFSFRLRVRDVQSTDRHADQRPRPATVSGGVFPGSGLPCRSFERRSFNDAQARRRDGSRDGSGPSLVGPPPNGKYVGILRYAIHFAEQVHGDVVAQVDAPRRAHPGADGLLTNRPGVCLAIYVADCAAVYLADRVAQAIGLVHAGRKGAELGIVTKAIATMREAFGTDPANLVVQVAPCIRPPNYEVDFAAQIVRQAREAGVRDIFDCGSCTASNLEKYYSYRRERGRTGRLLALAAIASEETRN